MDKAIKWKSLVLTTMIILVAISEPVYALSSHTPLWTSRPTILGDALDYSPSITVSGGYVAVLHNYYDNVQGLFMTGVTVLSSSDGSTVYENGYYMSNGYDVVGNGLLSLNGYYYVVGGIDMGKDYVGFILKTDSQLNLIVGYELDTTVDGYNSTFYSVCSDGSGVIYAVGRAYQGSTKLHKMLVASFDQDLNLVKAVVITLSGQNTYLNASAYSCTVGGNGDLYIAGTVQEYDSNSGLLFNSLLMLLRLSATDLSVVGDASIPLWNSASILRYTPPPDIYSVAGGVVVSFTYTDELPDPNTPSLGASIAAFDLALNQQWRKYYTTQADEAFTAIKAASNGWLIVGGFTDEDYLSGLGTTYSHGLVVVFDETASPTAAFIYGAGDGSSRVLDVAADGNGYIYTSGADYSDQLSIYDVTSEVVQDITSRENPIKEPTPMTRGEKALTLHVKSYGKVGWSEESIRATVSSGQVRVLQSKGIGLEETPTGRSSSLVIAYDYTLQAPPPVPEPGIIVATVIVSILLIALYRSSRFMLDI